MSAVCGTMCWSAGMEQGVAVGLEAWPAIAAALQAGQRGWIRVPGVHPGEVAAVHLDRLQAVALQPPAYCAARALEEAADARAGYEITLPCCAIFLGSEAAYFRAAIEEYEPLTDRLLVADVTGDRDGWARLTSATADGALLVRLDAIGLVLRWPGDVCEARNAAAQAELLLGDDD